MHITNVRAGQPVAPDSPPDWRTSMGQILVAVDTDRGLTGYGVGGGGTAGVHVIRTVLRDALVGKPVEPVEERWQEMYDATLPFGRKGLAVMALSGVDIALWDLRGKAANQSVAELLGGVRHPEIPVYITVWDEVPDELVGRYGAYKIHVGTAAELAPDKVERLVAGARVKVGPKAQLMLDAWMKWTVPFTLEVARRIAPYDIAWIEEPLSPDDLDGYAQLTQGCHVPIAGGEHEFTAAAFRPLIERRLHAVVQPDVCWCGGMTELVKIYRLAADQGVRVCPHRGAEVWARHALASLDPQPLAESGRPWLTWVAEPAAASHQTTVQISAGAGFGSEPRAEALASLD